MGIKVLSLFDGMSCGRIALERAGIEVAEYYASEVDKYAIKVSEHNYPDIIRAGDVTKVSYKDGALTTEFGEFSVGKIDLVIAGSPCFTAGTKIDTSRGLKKIEELVPGDFVLTHTNQYKEVLRVGGKVSPSTLKLKAQGIIPTTTTDEHPYYVRTKIGGVLSEPYRKEAAKLTKHDYIGININKNESNPLNLTEDECLVIGRYIAYGHTRKDYRVKEGRPNDRHWQLIISVGEDKLTSFKGKYKIGHSLYPHTKSVSRAVFSNKRLVEIVESYCGKSSSTKVFHNILLDLPKELLGKVLEGYMDGDGCYSYGKFKATTVSEDLAISLSKAVNKVFGVGTNIHFTKRPKTTTIEGRVVNQLDTYTVEYKHYRPAQAHWHIIGDIIWHPVREVIKSGADVVFNLEVEGDNSYTANSAIVHNCQGFSMSGKQLAFDDPRSSLYFEFERILGEIKSFNPDVKFLLENVKMKQEHKDVITQRLGVEPAAINSKLVSAQNRYRLYWTDISSNIAQPEDKEIYLFDILDAEVDEKYFVKEGRLSWLKNFGEVKEKGGYVAFNPAKAKCLTVRAEPSWNTTYILQWPRGANKGGLRAKDGKTPSLTVSSWPANNLLLNDGMVRKLTPVECERLQTVPEDYTDCVSDTQRYKMLGNGWTVDVIAHILKEMK